MIVKTQGFIENADFLSELDGIDTEPIKKFLKEADTVDKRLAWSSGIAWKISGRQTSLTAYPKLPDGTIDARHRRGGPVDDEEKAEQTMMKFPEDQAWIEEFYRDATGCSGCQDWESVPDQNRCVWRKEDKRSKYVRYWIEHEKIVDFVNVFNDLSSKCSPIRHDMAKHTCVGYFVHLVNVCEYHSVKLHMLLAAGLWRPKSEKEYAQEQEQYMREHASTDDMPIDRCVGQMFRTNNPHPLRKGWIGILEFCISPISTVTGGLRSALNQPEYRYVIRWFNPVNRRREIEFLNSHELTCYFKDICIEQTEGDEKAGAHLTPAIPGWEHASGISYAGRKLTVEEKLILREEGELPEDKMHGLKHSTTEGMDKR
jgi:hypothetical protein